MATLPHIKPLEILLVEDNPVDIKMTQEAFKEGKLLSNLNVVTNGVAAIEFLRRKGRYKEAARPDLILLDLNLPQKDGREILKEVKSDDALRTIPVVVLTTSDDIDDVKNAYADMANCYITKPIEFDEFIAVIERIGDFWLSFVKLPST
ncbi:MAG: response regulator [Halobacteriota archaeon]